MQMWQIVANLEFVTGFAIDLQTRKPNISPRGLGIEDPGLWRICPEQYRHLLHDERRQELNKSVKNDILKC